MADYIRRDIVLKIINTVNDTGGFAGYADYCVLFDEIDTMPAADVQPVDRWISVDDRLPENCIEVLVYDTDCGIVIGWYDKEIGDFAADFISPLDAVTHWQPLPEKPQD